VNVGLFSRKAELARAKYLAAYWEEDRNYYRELWHQSFVKGAALKLALTKEQIKNGKLRKAIHDAVDVMEKVAPVEEGK
jgi:hypothetical protein